MNYGSAEAIITMLVALAIGLAAGYVIWGYGRSDPPRGSNSGTTPARPAPTSKASATKSAASAASPSPKAGAAEKAPAVTAPSSQGAADDLKRIKGIGPKLEEALKAEGIHRFAQLAALDTDQQRALGERLGTIPDRAIREDWAGQAARLAEEDSGAR